MSNTEIENNTECINCMWTLEPEMGIFGMHM